MSASCLSPTVLFDFYTNRPLDLECTVLLSSAESPISFSAAEYFATFAVTCGLEASIFLPVLLWKKNSFGRSIALVLIANLATHPLISFVFPVLLGSLGFNSAQAVLTKELFAPLVETIIFRRGSNLSWLESSAVAIAANLFSWWLGSLIF